MAADGDSDPTDFDGSDSSGTPAKCSNFIHGFIYPCGDPAGSGGGGKSWHLYKIGSGDYPQYTSSILGQDGVTIDEILSQCTGKYQYFAAFGWDGHNGILWGPAAVGRGLISNALYNNYQALDLYKLSGEEIKAKLLSGEITNGRRLSETSAERLREIIAGNTHREINSNVGAFCFNEDELIPAALSAKSSVGASSERNSDVETTDIVSTFTSVSTNTIYVEKNHSAEIRFSHNLYSDGNLGEVEWSVAREGLSNAGFTVVGASSGSGANGTAGSTGVKSGKFTDSDKSGSYFVASPRSYSDGVNSYLWRDKYTISFSQKGTYTFCETLSAAKKGESLNQITKVCAVVQVSEGAATNLVSGACGNIASLSIGNTRVVTRVKNMGNSERTMSGTYSGWQRQIYAMPTDQISWLDCYLPGAQYYANRRVSHFNDNWDGHGAEGVCHNTTNSTLSMTTAYANEFGYAWTNQFKVSTSSPYGFNDSTLTIKNRNNYGGNVGNPSSLLTYWPNEYNSEEWKTYTNGDYTVRQVDHNMQVNGKTNVRYTYTDRIYTPGTPIWSRYANDGRGYHPWSCSSCSVCGCCCCGGKYCYCCGCCSCTFQHTNLYNEGWTRDGAASDSSSVTIPYNYSNSTSQAVSSPHGDVVYAGETIKVDMARATVGERRNNAVEATYTTVVDDASVLLIAYVATSDEKGTYREIGSGSTGDDLCYGGWVPAKQCAIVKEYHGRLNVDAKLHGETIEYGDWEVSYDVFDASAGDYMCFTTAIYPYTSGSDINTAVRGDGNWKLAEPSCIVIAKKPSVQILGGDLFTSGSIDTNVSYKRPLFGGLGGRIYDKGRNSYTQVVTGSWVEEGIIASGLVREMSSGASVGYSDKAWGVGGDGTTNFCSDRTPLSFANFTTSTNEFRQQICSSNGNVNSVGMLGVQSSTINRKALADYWGGGNMDNYNGYISGSGGHKVESATGKDIRVIENNGSVYINGGTIGKEMIRVVKAINNTVTIGGNIMYVNDNVSSAGSLPKVIIYGKDINIECDVERIDAILIAEGTINSCSTPNGNPQGSRIWSSVRNTTENNPGYSVQLIVNGAVIANKVILPRTYGNSVAAGSGNPAEIINYDSSTLIWGRYMAGASESDTMTVTYMRELAPRY